MYAPPRRIPNPKSEVSVVEIVDSRLPAYVESLRTNLVQHESSSTVPMCGWKNPCVVQGKTIWTDLVNEKRNPEHTELVLG